MSTVKLENINKVYSNNVQAVYDFNLEIEDGEFIVFVGPSGCGKSTTLRMIAGLEEITDGNLYIDGNLVNDLPSKKRDIAMVFQNYALYPHMSVYDNIAFGLANRHMDKEIIKERVNDAAEILGIKEYLDRKPKALSGGQCQRVALGRAIVRHAKVFLMDEPLSNLDAKLRVQMRSELIKLHQKIGGIIIYVTHDQTEAMTMADRIVVMSKGHVQQIGTPREIYNHPANKFVAGFMGSPTMNFLNAKYHNGEVAFGNGIKLTGIKDIENAHKEFYESEEKLIEEKTNKLDTLINNWHEKKTILKSVDQNKQEEEFLKVKEEYKQERERLENALKDEHEVILGIRPEDITIAEGEKGTPATVDVVELLGKEQIVHVTIDNDKLDLIVPGKVEVKPGDAIKINIDTSSLHLFDVVNQKAII